MADTRQNLAKLLAANQAHNLAVNLAGGAGVVPPSNWRLTMTAPQLSFRRLPDGSNVITADGGTTIQALQDTIAEADKHIAHVPYEVTASAPTRRPSLGTALAMVHAGGSQWLESIGDALAWGAIFDGNFSWAVSGLGEVTSLATTRGLFAVPGTAGNYVTAYLDPGGTVTLRRVTGGGTAIITQAPGTSPLDRLMPYTAVYDGTNLLLYLDGVLAGSTAAPGSLTGAQGFVPGTTTFGAALSIQGFFGDLYETFVQAGAPDATECAAIASNLLAEYGP